jgi:hypothetical protein
MTGVDLRPVNREAEAAILAKNCIPRPRATSGVIRPSGRGAERKGHGHSSIFASYRCPSERACGWLRAALTLPDDPSTTKPGLDPLRASVS